jgi:hypothetical protein
MKKLVQAGFNQIGIGNARVYGRAGFPLWSGRCCRKAGQGAARQFVGTFVRANKAATVLCACLLQNNDKSWSSNCIHVSAKTSKCCREQSSR